MIDFFHYQWVHEPVVSAARFGIIDLEPYACTTFSMPDSKWGAVVSNQDCTVVQFIPVDHNIPFVDANGDMMQRCDGMLYDLNHTYVAFIELKDRMADWVSEAIAQLESTVRVFVDNHGNVALGHRFAYACNVRHPYFSQSTKQAMQRFYQQYRFRLLVQRDVFVK